MRRILFGRYMRMAAKLSRSLNPIGRIPGIHFMHRTIQRLIQPNGLVRARVDGHRMYLHARDEGLSPALLRFGIYEPYMTEVFKKLTMPGMTVVDVGANIGYYSLLAAKAVGARGQVWAFEPDPGMYEVLQKNVELNGHRNVVLVPLALSDREGSRVLYRDQRNLGQPSFAQANVWHQAGGLRVPTTTLDCFAAASIEHAIDVIKVDVQGAEGVLLQGAHEILSRSSPRLFLEFWPFGLRNLGTDPLGLLHAMQDLGFRICVIDEGHRCLVEMEPETLAAKCDLQSDKEAHVNLLLEKRP